MGLCKCPKRKVTNQFCYEHRVNVCQYCMVTNHSNCIIQSYFQWLQDSDYDPTCSLCSNELNTNECVRLLCFHVYHWDCLRKYCSNFPETTAPAGYLCPTCREPIIPKSNNASPVAEALREKLIDEPWAKMSLEITKETATDEEPAINQTNSRPSPSRINKNKADFTNSPDEPTVIRVEESFQEYKSSDNASNTPRRLYHSNSESLNKVLLDEDENKYHRRAPGALFGRWFKRRVRPFASRPFRICGMILIAVIGFSTLYIVTRVDNIHDFDSDVNNAY